MWPEINGLYAITPDSTDTAKLLVMTEQVLAGGAKMIQYRNKMADSALRREQAHALVRLCRKYHIPIIINDHIDLAIEVNADGVHVGQDDVSLIEARKRIGQEKIIGVSCYNRFELAVKAEQQGADYVAFGAFFASSTKPEAVTASMDLLCQARHELFIPIVSIGGITLINAVALIEQGCHAIAISNALFGVRDIQMTAKSFSQLFCE
ncbi:MAG: thiamine phosphate synthase [Nitrosomonas sp.]|nr:thiamine phosphate synthase [Nitrosomonas sp.]MDP1950293.1 thiamine phosphate synthase [Nitrosomonas sp.]